jgi:hypothetical protein
VDLNDNERQLWEIDENLCRSTLTELVRGEHYLMRQPLYEKLHSRAAHGGDHRSEEFKRQGLPVESFVSDTHEKTGAAERTIRLSISRAKGIDSGVRDRIRCRPRIADNGSELDALKYMSPEHQDRAVQLIEDGTCKSVKEAQRMIAREAAHETPQNRTDDDNPSATEIPRETLDAASLEPRVHDLIKEIREIIDTLDTPQRANFVCLLSKVGDISASKIANCLI